MKISKSEKAVVIIGSGPGGATVSYELTKRGIPVGCNIESVAIRKAEIEASVELLHEVREIIKNNS